MSYDLQSFQIDFNCCGHVERETGEREEKKRDRETDSEREGEIKRKRD